MTTYLIIDKDSKVLNSIVYSEGSNWTAPEGTTLIEFEGEWGEGWEWDGEKPINPNPRIVETEMDVPVIGMRLV